MNPLIDAATAGNDFDFRELRRRPISVYVRINPDNIARLQPLLNLFFQQAIGLQTRELPEENAALKYQLLLVLGEFPALGRIPVIADSTAFLPGYNVRSLVIVQSNSQLVEKYGVEGAKSIRKMLAARIVYAPKDYDDAEAISRELGTLTVRQKSVSRPMWGAGRSASVSTSDQPRRLLLAQEVKELGPDRLLLFYEGLRPVLARRITYFREGFFSRREFPAPEVPALHISTPPPPGQPSASGKPARETTRPGNGQQAVTGRLLEAGAAPYRFDDTQGTSYFVRVQTDRGEKVLWGVELERALAQSRSGVQVGDMVTVRSLGARPVSVDAPRHDEAGRVVGHETVATRRRTWQVEKPEFVEQQAAKAAAFRDDAVPRTTLVEEHPDLTSAVVGLWLGEQFAARRIERPEDRKRLVALVRQRLAEAIERGEPIDTPKVRQAVARDLDSAAPDGERDDRGVASNPVRARTRGARAPEVPPHARA